MKVYLCGLQKSFCMVNDAQIPPCSAGMCVWGCRVVPVDAELPAGPGTQLPQAVVPPGGFLEELKLSSSPAPWWGVEQEVPPWLQALPRAAGSGSTSKAFPFATLQQEIKGNPLTLGSVFPTQTWFHMCCFIPGFDPDTLWTHSKLCSQCLCCRFLSFSGEHSCAVGFELST